MNNSCRRVLQALGVVLGASGALTSQADEYLTYSGTANSLQSQAFLYGEHDVLASQDGRLTERVVLYTCRNGLPFARKIVNYVNPFAPDFVLDDASSGMREGIRTDARGRSVFFRGSRDDAEKSAPLPPVAKLVADAGFDEFVRAHWSVLASGKSQDIDFLVPSRLEDIGFRFEKLRADTAFGVSVEVFRLKLSGFLGWFLSGIDVYYGAQDHVLIRYVGLSDLRGADGNPLKVDISFDPKLRSPAVKGALDSALEAHLAPCK